MSLKFKFVCCANPNLCVAKVRIYVLRKSGFAQHARFCTLPKYELKCWTSLKKPYWASPMKVYTPFLPIYFPLFLLLCYIETGNGNMGMNHNIFHIFSEYDYNACIEKYLQVEILLLLHMSVCPWNV